MPSHRLYDWIPSFLAVTLAHGALWYGLTHHRIMDDGPRILPVVQVSLVEFPPPRNLVTALQEKVLAPKKEAPAPTPDTGTSEPDTATRPAAATPESSEPVYSAAYLHNHPPAYPLSARRRGIQGTVLLRAEILAQGYCQRVYVKHSSGHDMLDRAAVEAVRRWRFVPARRGNLPVSATVEIPITFKLNG